MSKDAILKNLLNSIEDLYLIEYLNEENVFHVKSPHPTKEAIHQLYQLAHRLRENIIIFPKSSLMLDEIKTGYRDRCLQSFCYDTINLGKPGDQTCWENNSLITRSLGIIQDKQLKDDAHKIEILKDLSMDPNDYDSQSILRAVEKNSLLLDKMILDEFGCLHFKADISYRKKGIKSYLKTLVRKKLNYPKGKNIAKIVNSILVNGWDPILASKPQSGVLGFSKELGIHQVLHGKHRLASLKFLNSIGKVSGNLKINYPVITYDWGSWAQFRKYPGTQCSCTELWKN